MLRRNARVFNSTHARLGKFFPQIGSAFSHRPSRTLAVAASPTTHESVTHSTLSKDSAFNNNRASSFETTMYNISLHYSDPVYAALFKHPKPQDLRKSENKPQLTQRPSISRGPR